MVEFRELMILLKNFSNKSYMAWRGAQWKCGLDFE